MSNYDKWTVYTRDNPAPQSFLDFAFYFLIGAALQRRVWIGNFDKGVIPNPFNILCGPAGVGKGQAIAPLEKLLNYHKVEPKRSLTVPRLGKPRELSAEEMENLPNLIPLAPSNITFAKLVQSMAESVNTVPYTGVDEHGKPVQKIYIYRSLAFCLTELESLLGKNVHDICGFLLDAYDCGKYDKDTKGQGKDTIRNMSLAFFAGTTPAFISSAFDDKLLRDGLSSRFTFIYEDRDRFTQLFRPDYDDEQLRAEADLLIHIRNLTELFGPVQLEPSLKADLEKWWEARRYNKDQWINKSPKLTSWYARYNLHMMKLAMCIHFSNSLEKKMTEEPFEKAKALLASIEPRMHMALQIAKNKDALVAENIVRYIAGKPDARCFVEEVYINFFRETDKLKDVLEYLTVKVGLIEQKVITIGGTNRNMYLLTKKAANVI